MCSSCLSKEVEEPISAPKQICCFALTGFKGAATKRVFLEFRSGKQGLEGHPATPLTATQGSLEHQVLALGSLTLWREKSIFALIL